MRCRPCFEMHPDLPCTKNANATLEAIPDFTKFPSNVLSAIGVEVEECFLRFNVAFTSRVGGSTALGRYLTQRARLPSRFDESSRFMIPL